MPRYDFDLFTIGAGSGGVRASRVAAGLGARVACAEHSDLGGTCVNVGCIPKKLFVYAGHYHEDFENAAGFGWTLGARNFDWTTLRENKNQEIARLNGIYGRLLDQAGVTRIEGRATLVDEHTLEVAGKRYTAETILVATGSWPTLPDVPGIEHAVTSNEAFHFEQFPQRLVIVGGGYIAVELAGAFHGMGADVSLLYRGALFLRGFDDEVRSTLAEEIRKKQIDLRFECRVEEICKTESGVRVRLDDGDWIEADAVLYATGRHPSTAEMGLEEAGVKLGEGGQILVDGYSRSSVPNIWAIGDVTDRLNLTPVAIQEGMAFAATVYGGTPTEPDHSDVATAVFSTPPIGTVGLTEGEARERHGDDVAIYRSHFRPLKHTISGSDEKAIMKLVVQRSTDRVLGCHMVGADAGEIVQGFAVALKCGATKAQFDATVAIHPTTAEEFVTMREPVRD